MDPLAVIVGGFVLFFLIFVIALGVWHPRAGLDIVGRSLRDDDAEAEIEANDIDEMIDARNDRRRRRGAPTIGDDLEREVRRRP